MQGCKAHLCCFPAWRAPPPVECLELGGDRPQVPVLAAPTGDPRESQEEAAHAHSIHSPCPPSAQTSPAPSSCRRTGPLPTTRRARAPRWLWPRATWWTSWRRARAVSLLPCLGPRPRCLGLWPQAPRPPQGSALPAASDLSPPGPGALTVLPTLRVTLPLSVHPGAALGICTYCRLHCASLRVMSRGQANSSSCV